jgi:ABC-type uncharacterized transport system permease subunit
MSLLILRIATLLYAASAALYVAFFARPRHARLARVGFWVVSASFVVHAVAIGAGCREYGGKDFFTVRGGIVLAAWLAAAAFMVLHRSFRLPSAGAFVLPLVVVALIPATLFDPAHPDVTPAEIRSVAPHVVTAILAMALFAIAAGVALMYLLQEREVKGKRFGAFFSRLPPLEALDRLTQRLVRAGFAVFTVALLTGTLGAAAHWHGHWTWDPQIVCMVLVWLLFGALVQLRHLGLHGRRYAVLTMVGFLVFVGMVSALSSIPGVTRHAGDYGVGSSAGAGGAQ